MVIDNIFRTTDLGTVAYLFTHPELEFQGLTTQSRKSFYFTFTPTLLGKKLAFQFITGKASVNAFKYWESIKMAKRLVFEAKAMSGTDDEA